MGRKKTYDRDEIARKAMDLFWLHGFHGTSTQDLVDHMDVNRFSLYAEFGNKQGLYEAALSLYEREVVTHHFGTLEGPESGLTEIANVIKFFGASAHRPGSERGCLLCNSATERAPHDVGSRHYVESYLGTISGAFTNALGNAKARGEIRSDVKTRDEGRFLATTLLGFFVLLRARAEPAFMQAASRAARLHVDGLRP